MNRIDEQFTELARGLIREGQEGRVSFRAHVLVEVKVGNVEAVALAKLGRQNVLTHLVQQRVLLLVHHEHADVFRHFLRVKVLVHALVHVLAEDGRQHFY